jgi:hypothetical protein
MEDGAGERRFTGFKSSLIQTPYMVGELVAVELLIDLATHCPWVPGIR